jgi:hypothetical protein
MHLHSNENWPAFRNAHRYQVLTNQFVANGSGQNLDADPSDAVTTIFLTDFNPANMVTPGVTGLNDPNVPAYLFNDGIRNVVTDTSVIGQPNNGPNPSPNVGIANNTQPGLYEVPRHPNDIYFNAANWLDDQAEFFCIYNNPPILRSTVTTPRKFLTSSAPAS